MGVCSGCQTIKSEFIYFQMQLCGPEGLHLGSSLINNSKAFWNMAYCMTFHIDPAQKYFAVRWGIFFFSSGEIHSWLFGFPGSDSASWCKEILKNSTIRKASLQKWIIKLEQRLWPVMIALTLLLQYIRQSLCLCIYHIHTHSLPHVLKMSAEPCVTQLSSQMPLPLLLRPAFNYTETATSFAFDNPSPFLYLLTFLTEKVTVLLLTVIITLLFF